MNAAISADELTLFWSEDDRPGGHGSSDIWMATRESIFDDLGRPVSFDHPVVNVGPPINTGGHEGFPSLTADWPGPGSGLYFHRNGTIILRATWHPDCNKNAVDDFKEIADGDADDVNDNDIPDECEPEISVPFRRGDSNADGKVNIADGVSTLGFLFVENQELPCMDAADTDDSGHVDLNDSIWTFNWLFLAGAPPAPPGHEACGEDPTADGLSCEAYLECP